MNLIRPIRTQVALALLLSSCLGHLAMQAAETAEALITSEKQAGWKLLFNGKSLDGWRTYKPGGEIGKGWVAEDGILKKLAKVPGGDIMTQQTFDNFELSWDWRIAKDGNNGVKYFITEERKAPIGHEYQMLDDDGHPDGKKGPKRQTASFYDVLPPNDGKPIHPVGDWNHSRILVSGNHVEHWLNGEKVLAYELGSDALKAAVAQSKFSKVAGFGTKVRGHILLTDHQDECWFRNIKLRELN